MHYGTTCCWIRGAPLPHRPPALGGCPRPRHERKPEAPCPADHGLGRGVDRRDRPAGSARRAREHLPRDLRIALADQARVGRRQGAARRPARVRAAAVALVGDPPPVHHQHDRRPGGVAPRAARDPGPRLRNRQRGVRRRLSLRGDADPRRERGSGSRHVGDDPRRRGTARCLFRRFTARCPRRWTSCPHRLGHVPPAAGPEAAGGTDGAAATAAAKRP